MVNALLVTSVTVAISPLALRTVRTNARGRRLVKIEVVRPEEIDSGAQETTPRRASVLPNNACN
jgi:hypothetical protein